MTTESKAPIGTEKDDVEELADKLAKMTDEAYVVKAEDEKNEKSKYLTRDSGASFNVRYTAMIMC